MFNIWRWIVILIYIKKWVYREIEIFYKFTPKLGAALESKDALLLLWQSSVDCLIQGSACHLISDRHAWKNSNWRVWPSSKKATVKITQVLIAILILIDCVIKTLSMQKICINLLILVSSWQIVSALAPTCCTCATLIGNVAKRISTCIVSIVSFKLSWFCSSVWWTLSIQE